MIDTMIHDGLWSTFTGKVMGESSDAVNAELGIDREAGRLGRALAPAGERRLESGALAEEVVRVEVRGEREPPSRSSATRGSAPTRRPSRWPR